MMLPSTCLLLIAHIYNHIKKLTILCLQGQLISGVLLDTVFLNIITRGSDIKTLCYLLHIHFISMCNMFAKLLKVYMNWVFHDHGFFLVWGRGDSHELSEPIHMGAFLMSLNTVLVNDDKKV